MLKKNVTIISTLCGLRCPTRASRHPRPLRRTGTLPPHPGPGACAPHTRYVRRPGHTAHALDGIYGKTAPPPPKKYIGGGGGGGAVFRLNERINLSAALKTVKRHGLTKSYNQSSRPLALAVCAATWVGSTSSSLATSPEVVLEAMISPLGRPRLVVALLPLSPRSTTP